MLLAFPAADAATGTVYKQNADMTEITQGRQGPALYLQYDSYLGVASEQQGGMQLKQMGMYRPDEAVAWSNPRPRHGHGFV